MKTASMTLRRYAPADEDASVALWLRAWQKAYPDRDFAERVDWWRQRWRDELLPAAQVMIAETDGAEGRAMIGFVTVDPRTLYLDQIVVAPEHWRTGVGAVLIAEAKRLSPNGLDLDVNTDNVRARTFYCKEGFVVTGTGRNPISGKPVYRLSWRP